jgi:hypothetical protein
MTMACLARVVRAGGDGGGEIVEVVRVTVAS